MASISILDHVARKLAVRSMLSPSQTRAILALPCRVVSLAPGTYLVREGDESPECCALLSGFTCRHKTTGSGARQILAINLRGDLVDLENRLFEYSDHSVQALTRGEVAFIPKQAIADLVDQYPQVARALWLETLVDASIFREWILNVGRRDARQRVAHLFCEFAFRQRAAGLCSGPVYDFPMTQDQTADATGMTPVHVNRTFQKMRSDGLIEIDKSIMRIPDLARLEIAGDFNRTYLH